MAAGKSHKHVYKQFQFDFNGVQSPAERHLEHRAFADAGPLGLSAFAVTLLLISLINLRADNVVHQNIVVGMGMSSTSSSDIGKLLHMVEGDCYQQGCGILQVGTPSVESFSFLIPGCQ
jgi:succinate-acetate transporter protein